MSRRLNLPGTALTGVALVVLLAAFVVELTDSPLHAEVVAALAAAALLVVARGLVAAEQRPWLLVGAAVAMLLALAGLARLGLNPYAALPSLPALGLLGLAVVAAREGMRTARRLQQVRARSRLDGEERERQRWARELHDETLQELGAVQVLLASAAASGRAEVMARAIEEARGLLSGQISALRHLITELRPAALDQLGLRAALEALCRRTEQLYGLPVRLAVDWPAPEPDRPPRAPPDAEATVYRVAQEALTNVVKHSGAHQAEVLLRHTGSALELTVRDDGQGLRPDRPALGARSNGGFGLPGMRERVALTGGRLTVRSPPGGGVVVSAMVPLARDPARVPARVPKE